jgi:hypothetical protein
MGVPAIRRVKSAIKQGPRKVDSDAARTSASRTTPTGSGKGEGVAIPGRPLTRTPPARAGAAARGGNVIGRSA